MDKRVYLGKPENQKDPKVQRPIDRALHLNLEQQQQGQFRRQQPNDQANQQQQQQPNRIPRQKKLLPKTINKPTRVQDNQSKESSLQNEDVSRNNIFVSSIEKLTMIHVWLC